MKNFSDLLATKLELVISVNGVEHTAGLHDVLTFLSSDTVTVDQIEILPKYLYMAADGKLIISEPFYRWYHRASGQGWLLEPQ
jgi:hypothetical protein